MRNITTRKWLYAGLAAALLAGGLFQLLQGTPLGWSAAISAALLLIGLAVWRRWPAHSRWIRFLLSCGMVTGVIWLLAPVLGLLGWGSGFAWGGWGVGIGIALSTAWDADADDQTARDEADTSPGPAGVKEETET